MSFEINAFPAAINTDYSSHRSAKTLFGARQVDTPDEAPNDTDRFARSIAPLLTDRMVWQQNYPTALDAEILQLVHKISRQRNVSRARIRQAFLQNNQTGQNSSYLHSSNWNWLEEDAYARLSSLGLIDLRGPNGRENPSHRSLGERLVGAEPDYDYNMGFHVRSTKKSGQWLQEHSYVSKSDIDHWLLDDNKLTLLMEHIDDGVAMTYHPSKRQSQPMHLFTVWIENQPCLVIMVSGKESVGGLQGLIGKKEDVRREFLVHLEQGRILTRDSEDEDWKNLNQRGKLIGRHRAYPVLVSLFDGSTPQRFEYLTHFAPEGPSVTSLKAARQIWLNHHGLTAGDSPKIKKMAAVNATAESKATKRKGKIELQADPVLVALQGVPAIRPDPLKYGYWENLALQAAAADARQIDNTRIVRTLFLLRDEEERLDIIDKFIQEHPKKPKDLKELLTYEDPKAFWAKVLAETEDMDRRKSVAKDVQGESTPLLIFNANPYDEEKPPHIYRIFSFLGAFFSNPWGFMSDRGNRMLLLGHHRTSEEAPQFELAYESLAKHRRAVVIDNLVSAGLLEWDDDHFNLAITPEGKAFAEEQASVQRINPYGLRKDLQGIKIPAAPKTGKPKTQLVATVLPDNWGPVTIQLFQVRENGRSYLQLIQRRSSDRTAQPGLVKWDATSGEPLPDFSSRDLSVYRIDRQDGTIYRLAVDRQGQPHHWAIWNPEHFDSYQQPLIIGEPKADSARFEIRQHPHIQDAHLAGIADAGNAPPKFLYSTGTSETNDHGPKFALYHADGINNITHTVGLILDIAQGRDTHDVTSGWKYANPLDEVQTRRRSKAVAAHVVNNAPAQGSTLISPELYGWTEHRILQLAYQDAINGSARFGDIPLTQEGTFAGWVRQRNIPHVRAAFDALVKHGLLKVLDGHQYAITPLGFDFANLHQHQQFIDPVAIQLILKQGRVPQLDLDDPLEAGSLALIQTSNHIGPTGVSLSRIEDGGREYLQVAVCPRINPELGAPYMLGDQELKEKIDPWTKALKTARIYRVDIENGHVLGQEIDTVSKKPMWVSCGSQPVNSVEGPAQSGNGMLSYGKEHRLTAVTVAMDNIPVLVNSAVRNIDRYYRSHVSRPRKQKVIPAPEVPDYQI